MTDVAPPPARASVRDARPGVAAQIEAKPGATSRRLVWVVIPCFNRPADLALVLEDVAAIDLACAPPTSATSNAVVAPASAARASLRIVVVDNASATPLSALPVPAGLDVTFLRLNQNTGGAGGYNAGMAYALAQSAREGDAPEFLWLVDSDVRVERPALRGLIECLDARPDAVAAGSAIADMQDGCIYEVGGRIERFWGQFGPRFGGDSMPKTPIVQCTYTAACSALVRREAIEATGLFPEVFLNADDVEWFIRMARVTGKKVLATTESVVRHPFFGRYSTLPRYYMSRNCFGPLEALGLGWRVRLFRALRDVPRAVAQMLVGRDDLAGLHLTGMAHAAERRTGAAPAGSIDFERPRAFETLAQTLAPMLEELRPSLARRESGAAETAGGAFAVAGGAARAARALRVFVHKRVILPVAKADELHDQLSSLGLTAARIQRGNFHVEHEAMFHGFLGALWRLLIAGPRADVAIIHARGRPMAWCRGRVQVLVSQDGYVIRRLDRRAALGGAWRTFWRGLALAFRVAGRKPLPPDARPLPSASEVAEGLPALTASLHRPAPGDPHTQAGAPFMPVPVASARS